MEVSSRKFVRLYFDMDKCDRYISRAGVSQSDREACRWPRFSDLSRWRQSETTRVKINETIADFLKIQHAKGRTVHPNIRGYEDEEEVIDEFQ